MRYELIEAGEQWIVTCDRIEIARYAHQASALEEVADRLSRFDRNDRAALAVHFEKPEAI